jgi:hypothetical protein
MTTRYRTDGDVTCIDIVMKDARQLFDMRDPAPYRERALDDDAVEYLLGAARDVGTRVKLRVAIRIEGEPDAVLTPEVITAAVRAHLEYERQRQRRKVRDVLAQGRRSLAIGVGALTVLLSLAELTTLLPGSHLSQILREGLVIIGWVAMWRPLELLLYDWWPHVEQRRLIDAVLAADLMVTHR